MADHYYNANAIRRVGCGIALDDDERTPDRIRTAIRSALENAAIHRAATAVQADVAHMPGPEAVVQRIHALLESP